MEFPNDIEGILPALAVIVLGSIAFIILVRRRVSPERLGFMECDSADPTSITLAESLFGQLPHSVFSRRRVDQDMYLMFVAAGSSDTPDCVVGFTECRMAEGTEDLVLLHSEWPIPKLFRHLNGGVLGWTHPSVPTSEPLRPGKGWIWHARNGAAVRDVGIARVLASASRDRESRKLLGLASLGSQLVVWASLPHIGEVVSRLDSLAGGQSDIRSAAVSDDAS